MHLTFSRFILAALVAEATTKGEETLPMRSPFRVATRVHEMPAKSGKDNAGLFANVEE
jgi:hypothetical protein